jgi:uncharacterized delta-60 repeat protein
MPSKKEQSVLEPRLASRRSRQARGRRLSRAALLLAACAASLFVLEALAAPGDLDTTFDMDGKVTTPVLLSGTETARGMVVQPDGKIIVVGEVDGPGGLMGVVRYNADGSLDSSFDGDGKLTVLGPANVEARASAVALQADGKIVVAGYALGNSSGNMGFVLVRLNTDGSLDASFGAGGKTSTSFGNSGDVGQAVFVQPDGKIIVTGYVHINGSGFSYQFGLARYNADGSPDSSFGTNGKVSSPTNHEGPAWAGALQPDGKIIVAGDTFAPSGFALERYLSNGALDASFGTGGRATTAFSGHPRALAVQPDGKIVAAGGGSSGSSSGFALARYNANGSPDASFGAGGVVITTLMAGGSANAYAVAIQPDGKIVAAGQASPGSNNYDFALARYNADGSLDNTFGVGGKLTTAVSNAIDGAYAMAIQPDGRILAAGWADNDTGSVNYDFAVVRYAGDIKANRVSNFDTDRRMDIALWNPSNGNWRVFSSANPDALNVVNWGAGALGDRAVPADYDGDLKTDRAVWRAAEGNWHIIQSATNTARLAHFSEHGIPVAAAYLPQ